MTYMAKVMDATEFASWLFDNGYQIFNVEEKRTIELQELIDLLNTYSKHLETKGAE